MGTSNPFCLPTWQAKLPTANQVSNVYRNDPDVAMPAQGVFIILNGQPSLAGGTSESAPLLAGFMAVVNEQVCMNSPSACTAGTYGVGFANPPIYAIGATFNPSSNATPYAASFNDIVALAGTGPAIAPGPGYDLSTGWGSPSCGLVDQLSCVTCSGTTPVAGAPGSSSCVSFQSDPNNCGSCGNKCPGTTCVKGACTTQPACTPGATRCCDANGCGASSGSTVSVDPTTVYPQTCSSFGVWQSGAHCNVCYTNGSVLCQTCSGAAMCMIGSGSPSGPGPCVCP
jgi:hypothetical protein